MVCEATLVFFSFNSRVRVLTPQQPLPTFCLLWPPSLCVCCCLLCEVERWRVGSVRGTGCRPGTCRRQRTARRCGGAAPAAVAPPVTRTHRWGGGGMRRSVAGHGLAGHTHTHTRRHAGTRRHTHRHTQARRHTQAHAQAHAGTQARAHLLKLVDKVRVKHGHPWPQFFQRNNTLIPQCTVHCKAEGRKNWGRGGGGGSEATASTSKAKRRG